MAIRNEAGLTRGVGRRSVLLGSAATAAALMPLRSLQAAEANPVAATAAGKIRGKVDKGVSVFRGVPYGASTAGANRFKPPMKPAAWSGVRDAFTNGPSAPQDAGDPGGELIGDAMLMGNTAQSEDCLTLNVYTPGTDGKKRPVMVWLHGGAFVYGSGTARAYDGTNLARRGDVVVVGVNHRLNAFGYLYLGDVLGKDYATSGNAGMLDIVAALEWVRDNIGRFGGDPGNVTIFGQSGGGSKVSILMAMPGAKGLFHKAIVESGSALRQRTKEEAAQTTEAILQKLGLTKENAKELLTMPMARLVDLMKGDDGVRRFGPMVDGISLPRHSFDPDAPAQTADVPMIIGTTETEGTYRFEKNDPIFKQSDADMMERLQKTLGENTAKVVAKYKVSHPNATPSDLYWIISTESGTVRGAHVQAARKAALKRAPAYVYEFAWRTKVLGGVYRSPHTIEIPFAFDTTDQVASEVGTNAAELKALTNTVSNAWVAFARTGDPNVPGQVKWPPYNPDSRAIFVIDDKPHLMSAERLADLDLLASLPRKA